MPVPLIQQKCVACRRNSPAVTPNQIEQFRQQMPDWELVDEEGIPRLSRSFKFADFVQALSFTEKVGQLAEMEGHHPRIVTEWGRVLVMWWTHKIRNLHVNDFIAAAKTDLIYKDM